METVYRPARSLLTVRLAECDGSSAPLVQSPARRNWAQHAGSDCHREVLRWFCACLAAEDIHESDRHALCGSWGRQRDWCRSADRRVPAPTWMVQKLSAGPESWNVMGGILNLVASGMVVTRSEAPGTGKTKKGAPGALTVRTEDSAPKGGFRN
ncbi:hypothetical protein C8R44DRAFT_734960 [Mycena epipterygia]|nr:hypothetical protein C8R44DRAFT_734960 [Mycena epipterygia]